MQTFLSESISQAGLTAGINPCNGNKQWLKWGWGRTPGRCVSSSRGACPALRANICDPGTVTLPATVKLLSPHSWKDFFPNFSFFLAVAVRSKWNLWHISTGLAARYEWLSRLPLCGDLQIHIYPHLSTFIHIYPASGFPWLATGTQRWDRGSQGCRTGVPSPQPEHCPQQNRVCRLCSSVSALPRVQRGNLPLSSLGWPFLAIKLAKKFAWRSWKATERLELQRGFAGSLGGKFSVWGLFSIFDLIYSGALSLTPQGQPM